ncbi:RNA helicase [Pilimelia anulata]|uniref:RNA helicase n=1 Tax=Pilimelia anulata TaxID=53371 RepID=A0A8J3B5G6_9ACTN|nr:DEAD/DEAH box helicase [Pilimelia anulata]GGJ84167.1 RNA helicase [Pilimelia anulata]
MVACHPTDPSVETSTTFAALGVAGPLVRALARQGVATPFPIQAATLPDTLAGRDVLGCGRTGSGKTYAFVVPVLHHLATHPAPRRPGRPRALILVPTRELATQIAAAIEPLAADLSLRCRTVFGGVGAAGQIRDLRAGLDIVVACPGRLDDHVGAGHARLDAVEITVLDEADHMADLGFLPVVQRLLGQTPRRAQRLLFSATLDGAVDALVRRFLDRPVRHSVDSPLSPVAAMTHHVLHVDRTEHLRVLVDLVGAPGRSLVFARTRRRARMLARRLVAAGVPAVELHGDLAQRARDRNLAAFADGTARTLVATDIAARGIHVDEVRLVVHADPPVEHKAYLHRSGRTARAGAAGTVVTLMTDESAADVNELVRKAGVRPTTTRLRGGDRPPAALAGPTGFTGPAPALGPVAPATPAPRPSRPSRGRRRRPGAGAASAAAPTGGVPVRAAGGSGAAAFSARAGARRGR